MGHSNHGRVEEYPVGAPPLVASQHPRHLRVPLQATRQTTTRIIGGTGANNNNRSHELERERVYGDCCRRVVFILVIVFDVNAELKIFMSICVIKGKYKNRNSIQ